MQPVSEITVHPLELSAHGRVPGGEPLYRIVVASSRLDKAFQDGRIYILPRYEGAGDKWVIEKWLSAFDLTKMTPEQWQAMLEHQTFGRAQMEYPTEGDYEHVYTFEDKVDPAKAHAICSMIEFDRANFTDADRTRAFTQSKELEAIDLDHIKSELIKSALTREDAQCH